MALALQTSSLDLFDSFRLPKAIVPSREVGSYEAIWCEPGIWFKKLAEKFSDANILPSDLVTNSFAAEEYYKRVVEYMSKTGITNFGYRFRGTGDYPPSLEEAEHPIELLYFAGDWDLAFSQSISVVGTRNPSKRGLERTKEIVKGIVDKGYTVVSGLAEGIDTQAHNAALEYNGKTIAVVGTPLDTVYPKKNKELFKKIAEDHLVISQVPFVRYHSQSYQLNKYFFPERNKTMSAISKATIIIEAGEKSGTLIQARAAINQKRKLFILEECFENRNITWPEYYRKKGAIIVSSIKDIWQNFEVNNRSFTSS